MKRFFYDFSIMTKAAAFSIILFVPLIIACESVPETEESLVPAPPQVQAPVVSSEERVSDVHEQKPVPPQTKEEKAKPAPTKQESPAADVPTEIVFANSLKDALATGDFDEALAVFDNMPKELENDTGLKLVQASILVSAGRAADAKKIVSVLEKANPNNVDVLEMNLAIATATNDSRTQKSTIQKILSIDPTNAAANIRQAEDYALAHRYQQASNSYLKVLSADSDNEDALFGYAQMSYYQNNLSDAESSLARLLELDPYNSYALAYMAKLYAEDENYLRAFEYISRAVAVEPDNYDFYIDKGTYERYMGKPKDALASWTKCIELDPDYFLAYVFRAGLHNESKNYSKALADYLEVVRTNPNYYYAYEEIGMLQWYSKNWAAARSAFEKALTYSKNNFSYMMLVGATYLKENKRNDMRTYFSKALRNFASDSLEYQVMRLFHDNGPVSAENNVVNNITREQSTTKRGRMRFYMGLYYELMGNSKLAEEFYVQVVNMTAPMFFEYQIAEWGLGN